MWDIAEELLRWIEEGEDFAVAVVTGISGSAPRQPGAALAVAADGTVVGSVSGGCVESAVYELCLQALRDGRPVVERFGYSDDDAFAVGLTCGGTVEVLVTAVRQADPNCAVVLAYLEGQARGESAAIAWLTAGPDELVGRAYALTSAGTMGEAFDAQHALAAAVTVEVRSALVAGRTGAVTLGAGGPSRRREAALFIEAGTSAPRLIIFGATDFASALSRAGKFLGYHVTVCDARGVFATTARFPAADEVVVDWPHRYLSGTRIDGRTALCVLTHDAKFDVPVLELALRLPVGYVGAMGSRRTHLDRERRLRQAGVGAEALARLRSPIGLDLQARTPEETAVAIVAEILADREGGTARPLGRTRDPIHRGTRR